MRIFTEAEFAIRSLREQEIVDAMMIIWTRMKQIVEPSAAVTLAAVLANPEIFRGRKVGLVLTGGNVDIGRLPFQKL